MKRHFNEEDTQRENNHMKRCSSLDIMEMQITTTMRYNYIKIKKTNHFNCSKGSTVNNRNSDTMLVGVYKTGIIALGN